MPEQAVKRKLAAILAAEIVAIAGWVGLDEKDTLTRLSALRREIIDLAGRERICEGMREAGIPE